MLDPFVFFALVVLLPVVALTRFIGCTPFTADDTGPAPTTPVITVTPNQVNVGPGGSAQFTAKDSANNDITSSTAWSSDNGSFDTKAIGKYTAPNTFMPGAQVHITASYTPPGGTAVTATATVTLTAVTITITAPAGVDLTQVTPGQAINFKVQVAGVNDSNPKVVGGSGTSLPRNADGTFLYMAPNPFNPANANPDKITATSPVSPGAPPATVSIGLTSGNRAQFVGFQTIPAPNKQGDWNVQYGTKGFALAYLPANLVQAPGYYKGGTPALTAALPPTAPFNFGDPTANPAGLVKPPLPSTTRFAEMWSTQTDATPLTVILSFSDYALHQVALYCLDFDSAVRRQTFAFFDDSQPAAPPAMSPQLANFNGGTYAVWKLSGTVRLVISHVPGAGTNAVLSAIFFD